jgi:hypothetical protein
MSGVSKQLFIFFTLSVACIILQAHLAKLLGVIYQVDVKISDVLFHVTTHLGDWGKPLNNFISLIALPFVIAGVLSFTYWMFKHTTMPNAMTVVWVMWAVMMVITSVHVSENSAIAAKHQQQQKTQ